MRTFFIETIYFLKSRPFLTSSALHIHKIQYLSLNILKRTFLLNSSKLTILERNTYVQLSFVLQGFKSCWGKKKIGTSNSAWPSRLYQIRTLFCTSFQTLASVWLISSFDRNEISLPQFSAFYIKGLQWPNFEALVNSWIVFSNWRQRWNVFLFVCFALRNTDANCRKLSGQNKWLQWEVKIVAS